MFARDYRDLAGSGFLCAAGFSVALNTVPSSGTVSQMGRGSVPATPGFLLASLGAAIPATAWFRSGGLPKIDWHATIFIMLGVLGFALTIAPFGMVPAITLLIVASALADDRISPLGALILSSALSLIAYLVFRLGLGIVLEPFRWPF